MAEQSRATLKGYFETGDVPTESQFVDLIDSALNPTEDVTLAAIGDLTPTDGNIIVGNGSTWITESGATARGSLGISETATNDTIPVANGGTGATTASGARTNLSVYSTSEVYTRTESDDRYLLESNNLSDLTDASVARTNLGVGDTLSDVNRLEEDVISVNLDAQFLLQQAVLDNSSPTLKSFFMTSPDGTEYEVTMANGGTFSISAT